MSDLTNELTNKRTYFQGLRNDQKQKFLGQILWVSATVFAVAVIGGGGLSFSVTFSSLLFFASVVLNSLCILFCCISLFEFHYSADRVNKALAKQIQAISSQPKNRPETPPSLSGLTSLTHRGATIRMLYCEGKDTEILISWNPRKVFVFCERAAYVCFVLMVLCLSAFAFVK